MVNKFNITLVGQHPKSQLGLLADCQPDLFVHTFPAGGFPTGSFSFILLRLDIINVKYFVLTNAYQWILSVNT